MLGLPSTETVDRCDITAQTTQFGHSPLYFPYAACPTFRTRKGLLIMWTIKLYELDNLKITFYAHNQKQLTLCSDAADSLVSAEMITYYEVTVDGKPLVTATFPEQKKERVPMFKHKIECGYYAQGCVTVYQWEDSSEEIDSSLPMEEGYTLHENVWYCAQHRF